MQVYYIPTVHIDYYESLLRSFPEDQNLSLKIRSSYNV